VARTRSATSHALLDQIHDPVADPQIDPHLRMALHEQRQQPAQHRLRQRHRAGHAQRAAGLALRQRHGLQCRLGLLAHRGAVAVALLAGLGQRQLAGGALQQPHTEPGLEFRHPARQSGFRQPERPCRRRKAAVVDHLGEEQQFVQVLHRASIRLISRTIRCRKCI
jgi:hypothetical protein